MSQRWHLVLTSWRKFRDPVLLQTALLQEAGEDDLDAVTRKWHKALGRDVQALMTRTRCHKFDFRKRLVGMFFHAAPAFNFEGHGRLALSVLTPIGKPGPAYMYVQDSTNAAYNRCIDWPSAIQLANGTRARS
jgi:hypothetical protein